MTYHYLQPSVKYIAMQALTTTRFPATSPITLALSTKGLTPTARILIIALDRRAKGHAECWAGNTSLADALGCCERTVRNGLKALQELGLVKVIRDYTGKVNSRRRIMLAWRGQWNPEPEAPEGEELAANSSQGWRQIPTAETPPPLNRSPEGELTKETDDGPAEAESSSSDDLSTPQQEDRTPEPEAAPILEKAVEVLGDEATPGRVLAAAKEFGPAEVETTLEIARDRLEGTPEPLGWGWIRRVLQNRKAEGRPPYRRPPAPASRHVLEVNF